MKIKSGVALIILVAGGWYFYKYSNMQSQAQTSTTTRQEAQTILMRAKSGAVTVKDRLTAILGWSSQDQQNQATITNQTDSTSTQNSSSATTESSQASHSQVENSSSSSATAERTPIEAIVKGQALANTYTYSFTNQTPNNVRQVFFAAVAAYNQTGIVKLVPGEQTDEDNHITFSIYQKASANPGTLELGEGGPKIIRKYNLFHSQTTNHATASVNTTYQAAIAKSVAMHELGHALGLDHSDQLGSIMYPIDQGVTILSTEDLAGLTEIYPSK